MNNETGIRPPIGPLSVLASAQAKPRAEAAPVALARNQSNSVTQLGSARFASASAEVGASPFARPLSVAAAEASASGEDFGFADLLDIINPLQHIPILSTAYRAITGDEISAPARILGGFAYGGPLGLISSVANAVVDEISGKDIAESALAILFDGDAVEAPAVAAAATSSLSSLPANAVLSNATGLAPLNAAVVMPAPTAAPAPGSRAASSNKNDRMLEEPVLKGQSALDALRSDIRGIKAANNAAATTPATDAAALQRSKENSNQPAKSGPISLLPPHQGHQGASRIPASPPGLYAANQQPAAGLAAKDRSDTPRHQLTGQMLDGLDKYQAMMQERNRITPQYNGTF